MLAQPLIVLLAILSAVDGCGDASVNWQRMLPNHFDDNIMYVDGTVDATAAGGNTQILTLDPSNAYEFSTSYPGVDDFVFTDGGYVEIATTTLNVATSTTPVQGGTPDNPIIAALWVKDDAFNYMVFELKHYSRDDQTDSGIEVGAELCNFEKVESQLGDLATSNVSYLIIATWVYATNTGDVDNSMAAKFQLVLAKTTDESFALFYYDTTPAFGTSLSGITYALAQITLPDPANPTTDANKRLAAVCPVSSGSSVNADTYYQLGSNTYCGFPGFYRFELENGGFGGAYFENAMSDCASLDADKLQREENFQQSEVPFEQCYAAGSCRYSANGDDLDVEMVFDKDDYPASDLNFFLTDETGDLPLTSCDLTITANTASYVHIKKTFINKDVSVCGGSVSGASIWAPSYQTGYGNINVYTIYVTNYPDSGQTLLTHKTNRFKLECYPAELPTAATVDFTVGDITETNVPINDPSASLTLVNQAHNDDGNQLPFTVAMETELGTRIYVKACYDKGDYYLDEVLPYGIYGIDCWVSAASTFPTATTIKTLTDGCTESLAAFEFQDDFQAMSGVSSSSDPFCIVSGPFSLARWQSSSDLYVKCTFDFCYSESRYGSSLCKSSCPTTKKKKKRDVSKPGVQTLTAHLRIADESEKFEQSCADKTLAISAISILVSLLLVAMVMTAILLAKLRWRKNK